MARVKRDPAEAFLEEVLTGEEIDEARLKTLCAQQTGGKWIPEGQYIEFKAADWIDKDIARNLRKYVAGFANASGGVLVIGIGEPKKKDEHQITDRPITPILSGRKEVADDAVTRALLPIAPFLVPTALPRRVSVNGGEVLLIAVPRSAGLVSVDEGGHRAHYFRFGDSTVAAPAYLVEDLFIGRRQRPALTADVTVKEMIGWQAGGLAGC